MSLSSINKNRIDFICFSLLRADAAISSPALSLAKEFGKDHRVFFIEHPYSWKDYFNERNTPSVIAKKQAILQGDNIYYTKENFSHGLTAVTPQVVYSLNFLPQGLLYDKLSNINNGIVLKTIRKVISDNNISKFIFINFSDPFFLRKFPADIMPELFVYQCMDDFSEVAYTSRHGSRLEQEVIKTADVTLCTSMELTKMRSSLSENVHFFPNAADTDLFSKAAYEALQRPADLPSTHKKIIGFTGSIEYRMDYALLKKIALKHVDKLLFLIGPVMGDEHLAAGLNDLPNLIFAGAKDITELPAYLKYFDCAIIPYKKNKLTSSIYPLKINEYLAAGKPVIATDFSQDIRSFGDVAYIASDDEAFIQLIQTAVDEDNAQKKQQRIRVAALNSWSARAEQFWNIILK